ncbi:MAG: DUF3606 domain-containing protein [Xanthobacteraceae bacterium]|nr:DUF3606 domain-containing protein [Xanthobacteraceae bacterium]
MISLVKVSDVLSAETGVRPPSAVDTNDDAATAYWAYRLNISPDQLSDAIQQVGSSVAAIRRHLGK